VIGGDFTTYNGTTVNRIVRLLSNGFIDASYQTGAGTGANDFINTIALQGDGKLVIGGAFTSVNGVPVGRIARLNLDGTFDTTVNFGFGANNIIAAALVQNYDGRIVVGGAFTFFDNLPRNFVARIDEGYTRPPFNGTAGLDGLVNSVALVTTPAALAGKLVVGGTFTNFD